MFSDNILFKTIIYNTKEYEKSLQLRDATLRKPWGRSISEDDLSFEEKNIDTVIGAFIENELLGVVVLHPISGETCQIKYLAVYKEYQNLGVGKSLVLETERFCMNNNFSKIFLDSRDTALDFYIKLGYKIIGEYFMPEFVPILHIPMEKDILFKGRK